MIRRSIRLLAALAVLSLVVTPALGVAQTGQSKPTVTMSGAADVAPTDGPGMFRSYCAPCHGISGKGDGPAAKALDPKPADLTAFARRRGGTFSGPDFEEKLQGMSMASAHGSSDMPVWGPVFRQLGAEPLRMANLRRHVESMQVK